MNHLCIILLFPVLLQSCYIEEHLDNDLGDDLIEASLDRNSLRFDYSFGKTTIHSPSDGEVGYNLVLMWISRDLGKAAQFSSGTSINSNFEKTMPLYATSIKEHGPFYSGIQNSEINISKFDMSASSTSWQQHIRFMGGAEFIQKGAKDGGTKTHLYYLEVPLYATYWANITTEGKIFGGFGPYLAYGIGGNIKSQTSSVKAFDKDGDYKPFDAGITLTAGYKIPNSFSFRLAYDLGLANILRDAGNGGKVKTRTIGLNIGYPLNKLFKVK